MTRKRLALALSLVAAPLLAVPALSQVQKEVRRDAPAPITTISREALTQLPRGSDYAAILDLHNNARRDAGAPPLRWNTTLAAHAQAYADTLAQSGKLQHSTRESRGNERENLMLGPRSNIAPADMAKVWLNENRLYRGGTYPNVCNGDWTVCSHYTQMIWSATTDIGCGYAAGQYVALVCRYTPPGNMDGRPVVAR